VLRTVFEQPDSEAVHAQMRDVSHALEAMFPTGQAATRRVGLHRIPPAVLAAAARGAFASQPVQSELILGVDTDKDTHVAALPGFSWHTRVSRTPRPAATC
jgi:hypothetical protein